jgi:hypothetical protein
MLKRHWFYVLGPVESCRACFGLRDDTEIHDKKIVQIWLIPQIEFIQTTSEKCARVLIER